MNANEKVTEVIIELNQKNYLNLDLLKKISKNYRNMHSILIYDDLVKLNS